MKYLVILVLSIGFNASAINCPQSNVNTESVVEYLSVIAESLSHIKIQFKKLNSLNSKENFDPINSFVGFKELKSGYLCSSKMISDFKKSKLEDIAKSAESISENYEKLSIDIENTIKEMKATLNGKSEVPSGTKAEKIADQMLSIKNKWQQIIIGIGIGITQALDKENPKTKKVDTLLITKSERDRIINILKSEFNLPASGADVVPVDAAANAFYDFLNQKWKFKK